MIAPHAAPTTSRGARYALQCVFAFLCVALALEGRSWPTAATALAVTFEWTLLGLMRLVLEPRCERWRCAPLVALGAVGMFLATLAAARGGASSLDFIFIAWCGVPVALCVDLSTLRAGRGLGAVFGVVLLVSVAFGLAGSEPWTRPTGQWLLALATTTAAVLTMLTHLEAHEVAAERAGLRLGAARPVVVATVGRVGMALGGVVLLVTFALFLLAERGNRLWPEPIDYGSVDLRPPLDAESQARLDAKPTPTFDPLGMPDLQPSSLSPIVVALVQRTGDAPWRPLYLRDHVLDVYRDDGTPVLVGRHQGERILEDEADGVLDGRISFATVGGAFSDVDMEPTQQIKVVPVEPASTPRLAEPRLVWMEARALALLPSGAALGRQMSNGAYACASVPELYFAEGLQRAGASRSIEWTEVPLFAERRAVAARARALLPPGDDLERVRTLARHLRSTGTWVLPPEWDGSYVSFLDGERRAVCIHYAQTAAMLCRLAGLPARVAVGYLASEFEETADSYVVRRRHRHAWLEVEFEGLGWVGFEVTPARTPGDVGSPEAGVDPTPSPTAEVEGDVATGASGDPEPGPAPSVGAFDDRRWLWLGGCVALVGLAWILLAPARLRRKAAPGVVLTPSARRGAEFLRRLEGACTRIGVRRRQGETASELARQAAEVLPGQAGAIDHVVETYHATRFGDATLTAEEDVAARASLEQIVQAAKDANPPRPPP